MRGFFNCKWGVMKKVLFNAFWFIPVILFGCFNGTFSGTSDKIFLQDATKTKLDIRSLAILNKYGNTIKKYSDRYGVDWRLVVAVMKVESQFNHTAESHRGAKGFMQIMPATQMVLSEQMGLDSLAFEDPNGNIRGGIYYIAWLQKQFQNDGLTEENRLKLTLAAYNAGLGRVYDAQRMARYVNDDPKEWKSVKNSLSLLSKKYSSLHKYIWDEKKPSNGYFRDWKQTSKYVESVMGLYNEYKTAYPNQV